MHSGQSALQRPLVANHPVDSRGQSQEIAVGRADDDARMARIRRVKADEVCPIQRDQHTLMARGKPQHFVVRCRLTAKAALLDGQDVVPEPTQFLRRWKRKVLVRFQRCRDAASFRPLRWLGSAVRFRPGGRASMPRLPRDPGHGASDRPAADLLQSLPTASSAPEARRGSACARCSGRLVPESARFGPPARHYAGKSRAICRPPSVIGTGRSPS